MNDDGRDASGILDTWWGPLYFTRAENRFGLFWLTPPPGWTTNRNCFGTLAEAVAIGDSRPAWGPDHVYDFVHARIAYVFRLDDPAGPA